MPGLARQAVVLSLARAANFGLMLVSPIILVRILSVDDFGRYREFLLYTSLLVSFAGLSIYDSLLYFVPAHPASPWRIVRQTTVLVAVSSALVMATVVALDVAMAGRLVGEYLVPMAVYVLLFINVDFWEFFWLAGRRPISVFVYTAGRLTARLLVVIAAAAATGDLFTIIWSLVALESVRLAISVIAWRALDRSADEPPLSDAWREQLRFCLPAGAAVLLATANRNLGNVAVVRYLGAASLAHYTIGMYVEPIVLAIRNSISAVLLPEMVRRSANQSNDRLDIWRRATTVNCVLLFPCVVLLARFAGAIIVPVFGDSYRPSIPVMQIYLLVIIRECFDCSPPLRAINKTGPLVRSYFAAVVANTLALVALVPLAGIGGAISALVVSRFVDAAYLGKCVAQVYRVGWRHLLPWQSLAKVTLAAALPGLVLFSSGWPEDLGLPGIALATVVYLAVFAVLLWVTRVSEAIALMQRIGRAVGIRETNV